MSADLRLAVGLLALMTLAIGALWVARVPHRRAVLTASLRAMVQLAFVALVLRGVFTRPATAFVVVGVMFAVATWTAARRISGHDNALRAVVIACAAGASVSIAIIVGLPTLDRNVRTLVAVCGILFGNSMTAATLTGRRLTDGLRARRDEVEAWLSIGATMRQAVMSIGRTAVFEAMVPALDQTRTVGLVTLPGAFVGALLGGASASDAARFQVVVLVGVLCAQAITATTLAWLLGSPRTLPALAAEAGGHPKAPARS